MKLQIDTKAKTIKVDETVKFKELIKVLKKMFPDDWDEYSFAGNEVIYWYNPITWYYTNPTPLPWAVTYGSTGDNTVATSDSYFYNVEVTY